MSYIYSLPIGDWSDDGHGKTQIFNVHTNVPKDQMVKSYRATVEKTGIAFDSDLKPGLTTILSEYEESFISTEILFKLRLAGVEIEKIDFEDEFPKDFLERAKNNDATDIDEEYYFAEKETAVLFMEFCKASLPELEYEFVKHDYLFGFYEDLNITVGYGVSS